MLTVLSPAKKLLEFTAPYSQPTTEPVLLCQSNELVQLMKSKSIVELASLMDLSQNLAVLNYERFQNFRLYENPVTSSYPALFFFQGDVYQGLQAKTWDSSTVEYAQAHLCLLSGLYGLLRPLDRIQAYRLEMGTQLKNPRGANLYEYWRDSVTEVLESQLALQANPILINLASTEYFKVIAQNKITFPIVTINFYENNNNQFKMIGVHAKKARGTFAKFIMQNSVDDLESLKSFNQLGYEFHPKSSGKNNLDFVRY